MLDWLLGFIVVVILIFAYRYVKKHGKCTGCAGCKPQKGKQPAQPTACAHDCSQCSHCSDRNTP